MKAKVEVTQSTSVTQQIEFDIHIACMPEVPEDLLKEIGTTISQWFVMNGLTTPCVKGSESHSEAKIV